MSEPRTRRRRRPPVTAGPYDEAELMAYHMIVSRRLAREAEAAALCALVAGELLSGRLRGELRPYTEGERGQRIVRPMMSNVIDRLERLMATAHELAVTTDEVTSVVVAALGLVPGADAEQSVLDHLSSAFGAAGEDEPAVTETLRRIVEAVQERRRAAGLPPLLADDEQVGAKPRVPEGSEPNRIHGRRAGGQDGAERRRRRVRDGGTAGRGSGRMGRPLGGGPGLPKPKRGPGRRPSVSPDAKDGAESP